MRGGPACGKQLQDKPQGRPWSTAQLLAPVFTLPLSALFRILPVSFALSLSRSFSPPFLSFFLHPIALRAHHQRPKPGKHLTHCGKIHFARPLARASTPHQNHWFVKRDVAKDICAFVNLLNEASGWKEEENSVMKSIWIPPSTVFWGSLDPGIHFHNNSSSYVKLADCSLADVKMAQSPRALHEITQFQPLNQHFFLLLFRAHIAFLHHKWRPSALPGKDMA